MSGRDGEKEWLGEQGSRVLVTSTKRLVLMVGPRFGTVAYVHYARVVAAASNLKPPGLPRRSTREHRSTPSHHCGSSVHVPHQPISYGIRCCGVPRTDWLIGFVSRS